MLGFANAKINLGLNVRFKRADGFHELESVFLPVDIFDVVEILESEQEEFHCFGMEVPGDTDDNLCMKAYRLLKQHFEFPKCSIRLLKNIPFGAGLGGGSSDAAMVLKLINQKFNLMIADVVLEEYAAQLGSDCPFFIQNSAQLAKGRGEILEKVDLNLKDYCFLLIKPDFGISTKEAYSGILPNDQSKPILSILNEPIENWKSQLKNDFESALFPKYPILQKIKEHLYEFNALYASMSGSGSTMFGIFPNKELANNALQNFKQIGEFHQCQFFLI